MARKDQFIIKDEKDAFRFVSESLTRQAVRPNIYGYIPQDYQLPFHKSSANGRQFIGGNRVGKTVAGTTEGVYWATGKHPYRPTPSPPTRGRVVSVDFKQGVEKIVKPEFMRWLPLGELKGGSWYSAYDNETDTLYLENDSFIEFMSYEQNLEKFAGTSRHWTYFDEEPPKDIFGECKARLIDTGGQWWIAETPINGMTWTYDDIFLASQSDPNIEVFGADMTQNKYLGATEVSAYLSGLDENEKKIRQKGLYVAIGGLILPMFNYELHTINPIIPDRDWLWVCSGDHGINNPTSWHWHAVGPRGQVVTFYEHYQSGLTVKEHAQQIHKINARFDRAPDFYVGDPSMKQRLTDTGQSIFTTYAENGIAIVPGNNDVISGIERLRFYLGTDPDEEGQPQPRWVITRNNINLIREIQRYRWSKWKNSRTEEDKNPKEAPVKKDDHAIDEVRYFFMTRPSYEMASREIPEYSVRQNSSVVSATGRLAGQEIRSPNTSTEWSIESMDEQMGGIW